MVNALCERWSCPPSVALAEPSSSLRYVLIAHMGNPPEQASAPEGGD